MLGITHALHQLMNLQSALDRARHATYFGDYTPHRGAYPSVNVFENGQALEVIAELPGYSKEDLNLEIKKDLLRISGKRQSATPEGASVHRVERFSGNFDRTIKIPFAVDRERVQASYEDGLLQVTLPRHESEQTRKIAIS